ncbi:hypothetical protein KGO95_00585 [Patescibacteria group bacterium]|nr:hypothetical protein [Patescibacteria group bacterium]
MSKNKNAFERKADRIHKYLKTRKRYDQSFLPRPFFLEFTGSPDAGKTTTIKELDNFFRKMGLRVWTPQEGAEVIRHIPRTTPVYNLRTGLYALTALIDQSFGHSYDIVIFDRCVFDAYCWMMYWEGKELLTPEWAKLYQSFFLSPLWMDKIDVAYFMVADPKEAMKRNRLNALSNKMGETTNPATIKVLADRYRSAYKDLSPRYPQLRLLDTTKLNQRKMIKSVATKVLDMLIQKIKIPA